MLDMGRIHLSALYGFASRSFQILINFIFGILIIRFISIEAFGKYAFILALARFIPAILRFNNIHIFIREFKFKEEHIFKAYLTKYFSIIYLIYFKFLLILIFINSLGFSDEYSNLFIIAFVFIIFGEHLFQDILTINFNLHQSLKAYNINLLFNIFKTLPFFSLVVMDRVNIEFGDLMNCLLIGYLLFFLLVTKFFFRNKNFNFKLINNSRYLPTQNIPLFINNLLIIFTNELPIFIVNTFFNPLMIGAYSFFNSISSSIMNIVHFGYTSKIIPLLNEHYYLKSFESAKQLQIKMITRIVMLNTMFFFPLMIFYDFLDFLSNYQITNYFYLLVFFYFSSCLYSISLTFQKLFISKNDLLIFKLQLSRIIIFIMIFLLFINWMPLQGLMISIIISLLIFSFLHLFFERRV